MGDPSTTSARTRKARRNPRACDKCSCRSVRCRPSTQQPSICQNCHDYGEQCTFDRPVRRRGAQPKNARVVANPVSRNDSDEVVATGNLETTGTHDQPYTPGVQPDSASWRLDMNVSQGLVMDLTQIFFEVVYPVFPLFHRPSLTRRVARGEHNTCRPFCASVMAMCALASARARDGALYNQDWDLQNLRNPPSETLFDAAQDAIPKDAPLMPCFEYMRASVLLAICAIQYGKPDVMNHYLGKYHAFVAVGALHDEANWPNGISMVEREERRRLFWSTYTLDVFSSVVWCGIVRSREASSNVAYPTLTDEQISQSLETNNQVQVEACNWLKGWNFLTDLYRILEHAVDHLRRVRIPLTKTPAVNALFGGEAASRTVVLDQVLEMYYGLPECFKNTNPVTGDLDADLFSFQAANIAATVQLLRMVYFTNECSTLDQKCQVASEVIAGFATVPIAYLSAISAPLLHHLAEIGSILSAVLSDGLTISSYGKVRSVLLDLANLLGNLEADIFCPAGSSHKLRHHISRIDEFMEAARQRRNAGRLAEIAHSHDPSQTNEQHLPADLPLHGSPGSQSVLSPPFQIPPELLEDWSWIFDFTTASC